MIKEKTRELGILKKTTIQQMWEVDLARLEQALDQMENPGGTKRKDGEDAPSRSTVKSKGELGILKKTTIQQMWEADLARLEQALDQMENPGGTKRKDGEDAPSRSTVKSKGKQTRV